MLWKKFLSLIAGGILFLPVGCSKNPYEFNGMIKDVRVESGITLADRANFMRIRDPDGTMTTYLDYNWDLKLDCIKVFRGEEEKEYYSSILLSSPQVEEAQKIFDNYRQEIGRANFVTLQ